jgi:hypothetical protein
MRKLTIAVAMTAALSAHAEQKNVQLLTGMSDLQLQRTMNFIRASLGVHCDFCHVVNDKTGWDFPSDEKQTKRMAREMIQMTERINEQTFNGNLEVSCNTCHRGATRPVPLPILPQSPPPFPTPVSTRPAVPPLPDIVKKYTTALGDVSKLQLPRILKGTREGYDGKPLPFELQETTGKAHVILETPNGKLEQAMNGTAGWSRNSKGVQPFGESEMENFRQLTSAYAPLLPDAIPADARVIGKDKVGDHDVVVVAARINETTRQRLYFDATTGLLVRRLILTRTSIAEIPQQTDFDDYRDVGGAKFPFFVRLSLVDPWTGSTRRYTDVQLGAKLDDSVFNPPAESRPSS